VDAPAIEPGPALLCVMMRTFDVAEVNQGGAEIHVRGPGGRGISEMLREGHRALAEVAGRRVLRAHDVDAAERFHRLEPHQRDVQALREDAHPREGARGIGIAPAVDRGQGPAELIEKRHLLLQALLGFGAQDWAEG